MKQFFKENLDKQLKFLGLVVGFWALIFFNATILLLVRTITNYESFFGGIINDIWLDSKAFDYILIGIFQTWVIIKYIMKK